MMGRLTTKKARRPDPEKAAKSKEVWAERERRKNMRGRYDGALALAGILIQAGHHDAAEIAGAYASILAKLCGINQ